MNGRPYVLAESTWKSVDPTPYSVAVLPWGATEAHNYHLPYGTDNVQAEQVAIRAAALAWERGARVWCSRPSRSARTRRSSTSS